MSVAEYTSVPPAQPTQSELLAKKIRGQIVGGQFAPGKKLPTFQEMESRFNVSRGVIQLAVERLKRDGFVRSRSRQGLYVVPHPPHLRRYGIVFGRKQDSPIWPRVCAALVNESQRIEQSGDGRHFEAFFGTDDHHDGEAVRERLYEEVTNHRLAGLILEPVSFDTVKEPPLSGAELPRVYLFGAGMDGQTPAVTTDQRSLVDRAFGWFRGRGRERVAVIHQADTFSSLSEEDFRRNGLEFRPQWIQAVGRSHPRVVRNLIPLLMDYPASDRPDALFIADDNLVEYASAGVISMGLHVGADLDIVAHCNWPWPVPSAVPMQRIGFHVGQLLERCIEVIDAQVAGESVPDSQKLPALFEDEAQ